MIILFVVSSIFITSSKFFTSPIRAFIWGSSACSAISIWTSIFTTSFSHLRPPWFFPKSVRSTKPDPIYSSSSCQSRRRGKASRYSGINHPDKIGTGIHTWSILRVKIWTCTQFYFSPVTHPHIPSKFWSVSLKKLSPKYQKHGWLSMGIFHID